jgi:gas vesicle protein
MESKRRDNSLTMRAFLWGCALGASLGLLFAPKRGEETRADVQRRLNEWQGLAQNQMMDLRDKATIVIEQGRQGVNTTLDKVQSATNQVADKAKESVNGAH